MHNQAGTEAKGDNQTGRAAMQRRLGQDKDIVRTRSQREQHRGGKEGDDNFEWDHAIHQLYRQREILVLNHLAPDLGGYLSIVERPVLLQTVKTGTDVLGYCAEFMVFQLRPDFTT